jgi:hypothetical protein
MSEKRIYYTPNYQSAKAIEEFMENVKATTGLTINRTQALGFFVDRGVKSWRRRSTTDANGESENITEAEVVSLTNGDDPFSVASEPLDPFAKFRAREAQLKAERGNQQ